MSIVSLWKTNILLGYLVAFSTVGGLEVDYQTSKSSNASLNQLSLAYKSVNIKKILHFYVKFDFTGSSLHIIF